LQPKFSVQTDEVVIVGTSNNQFPQPVIDRREANTTLLVEDGQTVVLGGLRKKEVSKLVNKVPLLGDIPIICYLFRFEGEDTVTSELVVFITPTVIEEARLNDIEKEQYKATNFAGPSPNWTRAEKKAGDNSR